jgi:hypothetical protein
LIEDHAARFRWPGYWIAVLEATQECSEQQAKSVIERDPNKIDIFHEPLDFSRNQLDQFSSGCSSGR